MRIAGILALTLVAGAAWSADSDVTLKKQVAKTYAAYSKAVLRKDINGVMKILTPDVVWILGNGKTQHVDEVRKGLIEWMNSIEPGTKMSFEIEKFNVDSPDKTEATVVLHITAPGPKRKEKFKNEWHDTWVRNNGAWQNSIGEQIVQKAG